MSSSPNCTEGRWTLRKSEGDFEWGVYFSTEDGEELEAAAFEHREMAEHLLALLTPSNPPRLQTAELSAGEFEIQARAGYDVGHTTRDRFVIQ